MSGQLTPLSINPGVLTKETLPLGIVALKVSNTSPYDLSFSGYGVSGDDVLPAGVEQMLYGSVYNSGVFQATLVNNRNIVPANAGVVLIVAYYADSEVPQGSWPVTIPTSTVNVSGNSNVTTAQFLQNDSSTAGTVFIESTVGTNQATKVTVDGVWNLSVIIAGVLHQFLKTQTSGNQLLLGQASDVVEIVSNLLADGTSTVNGSSTVKGTSSLDNGNITTDGTGNVSIVTGKTVTVDSVMSTASAALTLGVPSGQTLFTKVGANLVSKYFNNGSHNIQQYLDGGMQGPTGDTLCRIGSAAGTGSGTFSHSTGAVPDFLAITTHAVGSQTVGYDSETSTQVHVTTGSGLSWFGLTTKRT